MERGLEPGSTPLRGRAPGAGLRVLGFAAVEPRESRAPARRGGWRRGPGSRPQLCKRLGSRAGLRAGPWEARARERAPASARAGVGGVKARRNVKGPRRMSWTGEGRAATV